MAQIWPKMAQKWPAFFPQFFFDWKGGSANFFAFRMYVSDMPTIPDIPSIQIRFPVKDFFLHKLELTAWTAESEFKINSKKNSTKKNQCFFFLNLFQFLFLQIGITPIIFAMFWFGLEDGLEFRTANMWVSQSVTKVGKELLGQLKKQDQWRKN